MKRLVPALAAVLFVATPTVGAQDVSRGPLLGDEQLRSLAVTGVVTAAAFPFDEKITAVFRRARFQSNRPSRLAAATGRYFGFPGALGASALLYVGGRATGNRHAARTGLHAGGSVLLAIGAGSVIKGIAGRARPYESPDDAYSFRLGRGFAGERFRSFPSGHALSAFSFAAAVVIETRRHSPESERELRIPLYALASITALSRVYEHFHWTSDVVAGAGLGVVIAAAATRFADAHPNNELDRRLLSR